MTASARAPVSGAEVWPGASTQVGVFAGLFLFYLATAPANHSFAVDAYSYALKITGCAVLDTDQPRQLLWIAAMQGIYCPLSAIAPGIDVFRVIGTAGAALTALLVMLFAHVLVRDLGVEVRAARLTAGLFGATNAIWRYATEIEVYVWAAFVALVLIHLTFRLLERGGGTRSQAAALGVLGGVTALTYQPLAIPAGLVVPAAFLLVRRPSQAVFYCLVSGAVVFSGFAGAYALSTHTGTLGPVAFILERDQLNPGVPHGSALVKVAYAIGHDFLSTYWVFGIDALREPIMRMAPDRFFSEEVYAATRAGWLNYVPVATLPAALVLAVAVFATALRRGAQPSGTREEALLVLWLLAHATMMSVLSPAGFEGWILSLVPLLLIAGRRLAGPAVVAGRQGLILGLLAVFVLHNGLSAMGMQLSRSGDYFAARGDAIIPQAGTNDLIVVAADWGLYKYLRYSTGTRVIQIPEMSVTRARDEIDAALASGQRVILTDNVMSPPPSMAVQDPELATALEGLAERYRGGATAFPTGDAGSAYLIAPPAGAGAVQP